MTQSLNTLDVALEGQFIQQYPLEVANFLQGESPEMAATMLTKHPVASYANLFELLPNLVAAKIMENIKLTNAAKILELIDSAKAGEVLLCMAKDKRELFLAAVAPDVAEIIKEVMGYPPDTAGSMMDKRFIPFTRDLTVAEAIRKLKHFAKIKYRVIFLVDEQGVLKQYVHIQDLLFAEAHVQLKDIAKNILVFVSDTDSMDLVNEAISQSKVADLPVVDYAGKLTGVIRYKTIVESIQEKAASEMQMLVGVSKEERALSSVFESVKKRLPWLQINLLTAFLAAAVVGLFEGMIAQYTALAVLLPVVAGQSGNTGAQALAVTMRGLVLREVRISQWFRLITKEMKTGMINGLAIAVTTSLAVYLWSASLGLCLIIFLAMIASMVIAGIAGAAIPLILSRFGLDPASSSSIILTTVTDVCGFFSFLGIATLFMFML